MGVTLSDAKLKRYNELVRQLYAPHSVETLRATFMAGIVGLISDDAMLFPAFDLLRQPGISPARIGPKDRVSRIGTLKKLKRRRQQIGSHSTHAEKLPTIVSKPAWPKPFSGTRVSGECSAMLDFADHGGDSLESRFSQLTVLTSVRSGSNLSTRDRQILKLIQPHLEQAFERARLSSEPALSMSLTDQLERTLRCHVVLLDCEGRILFCAEQVRTLLKRIFLLSRKPGRRLPETLDAWVQQHLRRLRAGSLSDSIKPIVFCRNLDSWHIHILLERNGGRHLLLIESRGMSIGTQRLRILGFTVRQAEVLYWLAAGKRNEEIARILGVSFFTVKTHLKSIFRRLGVETRAAAAALATVAMSEVA